MRLRIVIPLQFRYKKVQKKIIKGVSVKKNNIHGCKSFFYLKSLASTRMSLAEMEAVKNHMSRKIKKKFGIFFFLIQPQYRFTTKSTQSRMGKGKGLAFSWWAPVYKNQLICGLKLRRFKNPNLMYIFKVFKEVQYCLSFPSIIIKESSIYV